MGAYLLKGCIYKPCITKRDHYESILFLHLFKHHLFGLVTISEAQPIKVGAVLTLTGPASSWGQYHAKGIRIFR
jgi:ABC-type branched-subunit amino acid transport system substrate-binding protein